MPDADTSASQTSPDPVDPARAPKGRPTPKRKQAEAVRRKPLVPGDRKAAAKAARARSREIRDREFAAMKTGDERHLPARDKGPVRRFIRDWVDSRWSLGEFFLPIAIVFVILTAAIRDNSAFAVYILVILYSVVIATIVQAWVRSRRLRKDLFAKFGNDGIVRGNTMYGVMRSFQIRRTRLPKPQVARGERPS